jgi:hypothetical protein
LFEEPKEPVGPNFRWKCSHQNCDTRIESWTQAGLNARIDMHLEGHRRNSDGGLKWNPNILSLTLYDVKFLKGCLIQVEAIDVAPESV